VVPFLSGVFVDVQHLSQDQCQAGDRHLKFHEIRDNLPRFPYSSRPICTTGASTPSSGMLRPLGTQAGFSALASGGDGAGGPERSVPAGVAAVSDGVAGECHPEPPDVAAVQELAGAGGASESDWGGIGLKATK